MLPALARLNPFTTPEARRLAVLFAVVYFAQGMWYLPNQTISIDLKDRGLTAGQVAMFFAITSIPWLLKPLYSFAPAITRGLRGQRRLLRFPLREPRADVSRRQ